MNYLENLNPNQEKAILATSKYTRIIAGAGSGKTRVLISRVAYLIETLGVYPGSIVAITFTNKAANEMKERLIAYIGERSSGVHVSTIHSLCVRILREDGPAMKLPRNFTVIDHDDQVTIVKEAYRELAFDKQKHNINHDIEYIGANKGAEITPERALELAGFHQGEQEKAQVYQYYVNRQKAIYALDFDDLLLVTVKMFDLFSDVLNKWQRRFNFIHVDEFQDIDNVQYKLIKQLAGPTNQVYVVGDPDQTIYTWRGANVNIIMDFPKDYPGTDTIVLNQNYRSTNHILGAANTLIKFNQYREAKDLFTVRQSDEKVTHCTFASEEHEAKWIADKIKTLHATQPYKDIAILYRASYLSRSIENGLRNGQIPYVIYGGTRFYDREEVKNMLAYLRMIVTHDDLAFKRIINVPRRGIGDKSVDTIFDLAKVKGVTMYEASKTDNPLKGKLKDALDDFTAMIEAWKAKVATITLTELFELVAVESGLKFLYEENNETDRLENIKELVNDIATFQTTFPEAGLDEYLQMVSLYGERNEVSSGDYVTLMTVHAAKGLEFGTVFVVGMSEGIFPNERALAEGGKRGLEEERRLAYVAYTRAKHKLYLSETKGYSFILGTARRLSRFIEEIDEKHIDHIGVNYDYEHPKEVLLNVKEKTVVGFGDKMANGKAIPFKVKDWVNHPVFGDGQVLSISGSLAEIMFAFPAGIKKILATHPSLTKIEVHDE